jgi:hypothetical protein
VRRSTHCSAIRSAHRLRSAPSWSEFTSDERAILLRRPVGRPADGDPALAAWSTVDRLDGRTFESFLSAHDLKRTNLFDLSRIRFGTPTPLDGLLLAAEAARRYHDGVIFHVEDATFRSCLSRSRFLELAQHPHCRLVRQAPRTSGDATAIAGIELTRIEAEGDVHSLIDGTLETLTGPLGYSRPGAHREHVGRRLADAAFQGVVLPGKAVRRLEHTVARKPAFAFGRHWLEWTLRT